MLEFHNSISYVKNTSKIKQDSNPEKLYLICGHEGHDAGYTENWKQVNQVMSATGNHRGGRSCSGNSQNFAFSMRAMYLALEIIIEPDLNAEADCQTHNKIPELRKLILGEIPSGNQSEHRKINSK